MPYFKDFEDDDFYDLMDKVSVVLLFVVGENVTFLVISVPCCLHPHFYRCNIQLFRQN